MAFSRMGQSYKKWTQPAMIAGWVVLAGGCAAPANMAGTATPVQTTVQPPAQSQPASDKRFIIAPELQGVLQVLSVSLTNPPGAYLKIQFNVTNKTGALQQFRYRIDWFDKDGGRLPLGSDDFIPWMLMPHEFSSIAATAPAPMAADFGIAFIPNVK
jgi:hypothetical protein